MTGQVLVQIISTAIPIFDQTRVVAAPAEEPRISTALDSCSTLAQSVHGDPELSSQISKSDLVNPVQIEIIRIPGSGSTSVYGKLSMEDYQRLLVTEREGRYSRPRWFKAVDAKQQNLGRLHARINFDPVPAVAEAAAGNGMRKLGARVARLLTLIGIPSIVACVAKLPENLEGGY